MDTDDGGQFSRGTQSQNEKQRETATEIARRRVLEAYAGAGKTEARPVTGAVGAMGTTGAAGVMGTTGAARVTGATGEMRAAGTAGTHLKDQPVLSTASSEEWRKYHSAWQNYYQKYYGEYYANAARDYIERERLKDARRRAEEEEAAGGAVGEAENEAEGDAEIEEIGTKLKQTIQKKAARDSKKSRRRWRWAPFVAGAAVALLVLFLQYNRLIFAPIFAYMSPGEAPATEIEALNPTVTQTVSADPRLLIPKLNVDVPVHFGLQLDEVMPAMENGVAHYRIAGASAYPGEVGNTVITGHSAGDVYSSNPYKYIFSGLERLEEGDLVHVNYQSVRYTYQVYKKEVVEPTNVAALVVDTDEPILTLVTCTPLGTSRYRLLVFARQIAPSFEATEEGEEPGAPEESEEPVAGGEEEELPANEPSFFENVWKFLTGQ